MKSLAQKCLTLLMALVLIAGILPTAVTAGAAENVVIEVSEQAVNNNGFRRAVQAALDTARSNATAQRPYTVVAPAGTYHLDYVLHLYSNTTLDLRGVTLIRAGVGAGNMLRVGDEENYSTGVEGYAYENARLIGGIFDGNYGENTIIKAFHTRNFTIEDTKLIHEAEGHMMEYAGVDGLTIRGCTFQDQLLTPGNFGYEVIQLDVLHPFHVTNGRSEDLPMSNVLIENCTFDNVPRAIGSHTGVHNAPHDNIVIRNNRFTNLSSIAVQGVCWTNVDIRSNYIENAPRGITVYAEPDGCTYLSSMLAAKGGTQSHVTDAYLTPPKANINIAYNTLINVGFIPDAFVAYSSQGIAVIGSTLEEASEIDKDDESGGLPAGDYYIDGVDIHDNYIDIRGNGVRVEHARNARVAFNEILCSENAEGRDNYYGIVARNDVSATEISFNTIRNAEVNGIQIADSNVQRVEYNRIEGTGKYGIAAYDSRLGGIYDSDIMNTANIGLFVSNTTVQNVRWNRIRNCSSYGIWIASDSTASVVTDNTTYHNANGNVNVNMNRNNSSGSTLETYHIPWYPIKAGARMGVGTAFKIVPDVRPNSALASFIYTSSDSSVASVDSCGMIFAHKEGTATIRVTSDNNVSRNYYITVEGEDEPAHFDTIPAAPVLILGDADGNGAVESIDAALVQRFLAYMETPVTRVTLMHGDVDSSGSLALTDVTYIQRYLAQMSTPYDIGGNI